MTVASRNATISTAKEEQDIIYSDGLLGNTMSGVFPSIVSMLFSVLATQMCWHGSRL